MIIVLEELDAARATVARAVLRNYRRAETIVALRELELPALDGIIILDWDAVTRLAVANYLERRTWDSAMVRSDVHRDRAVKPEGGFLCPVQSIGEAVEDIFRDERIPILLEPCSRFDDVYSGNILFDMASETMEWEIVGSGFDLSDLNRGYLGPHEQITTLIGRSVEDWSHLTPLDVRRHQVIDSHGYRESWTARAYRIAHWAGGQPYSDEEAIAIAERFLDETNHPLFLKARDGYRPFGYDRLCRLYSMIADLPDRLNASGLESNLFTLSFGVLVQRGLIFWDIFRPLRTRAYVVR